MPALSLHRVASYFLLSLLLLLAARSSAVTFNNPELIETSYDPIGLAVADLNRDGVPDIAYINGMGTLTLHVLIGNGNGSFSHVQDINLPQGIGGLGNVINIADVTHDSILDIVVGGSNSSYGVLAVLVGNGDGTFQLPVVSYVQNPNGYAPSLSTQMGIGDINGDGAADIVVPDTSSGNLYVLVGDNTGHFSVVASMVLYLVGPATTYLTDLNGDGHLDIVTNNLIGARTFVLLGKGDGTFQPAVVYNNSYGLLLADMDGDGHPDLVGEVYPGQVQILKGNPDGTFGSPIVVAAVPATTQLTAVGDFNGDGIADLVFLTPAGLAVLVGQGNLKYNSAVVSMAGTVAGYFNQWGNIAAGDFNGDGHLDLAMGVEGGVLVLAGNGDGSFVSGDIYDVGHSVGAATVADFNGDKRPDIAVTVAASYPRLLLGNGAGYFTLATDQNQSYGSQAPSASMVSADFNGDGKSDLDIIEPSQAYPYGQPFVLLGAGDGTFATPAAIATAPSLVADLNNDGRSDMLLQSNGSILALLGQGNKTFQQVTTSLIHPTFGLAAAGDLNGDAKPDLLAFEYQSVRVWLGNGDGTFTEAGSVNYPDQQINPQYAVIADLDGDGNGDFIVVSYPNQQGLPYPLVVYYGNGDGTFQSPGLLPTSHPYTQLVVADINNDNKPDLILSDGHVIAVMNNLGNRSYGNEEHYVAGQNISGLSARDLNGDGFPDIVAANANGSTVAVLLNQPNGKPVNGRPSNGTFTISPEPAQYAQPVTLSIEMSASPGPVPTGTVSFSVDGSFITTVSLANGKATVKFNSKLDTGAHTLVATYNGDTIYASESFLVMHIVLPPVYATSTVLVAVPDTVYTSQTVSLTATVNSSVQVPAGSVTFYDGTTTLGSRQIYQNPTVLLDTNLLTAGSHSLTAVYHGWQDPFNEHAVFEPSTSAPVTVAVNATPTTTTLSASSQNVVSGTVVTFTAGTASGAGTPFGGVTFYDGAVALGTSSLKADGSCTYSIASLSVGTHDITAAFNANETFAGSTSPGVVVTVTAAQAGLQRTAIALGLANQDGGTVLVTHVSAVNNVTSGDVTFLDNGGILGRSMTDESGTAALPIASLSSGTHHLYASFSGSGQFASSVSPEMLEQFPSGGVGFSLSIAQNSLEVTPAGSDSVLLSILPVTGFQQQVHLTCTEGVPAAYECSFSPATLYSGNSYLRIQSSTQTPAARSRNRLLYGVAIGVFSFIFLARMNQRDTRHLLVIVCAAVIMNMMGCGSPPPSPEPQMKVLSIRGTAGEGTNTIVHSAQLIVIVDSAH